MHKFSSVSFWRVTCLSDFRDWLTLSSIFQGPERLRVECDMVTTEKEKIKSINGKLEKIARQWPLFLEMNGPGRTLLMSAVIISPAS